MSDRFWIARIEDRELRERVRRLMIELMMLSDAPVANLNSSPGGGKPTAKPPPRQDSLYEKYASKFAECCTDLVRVEATRIKAQAELEAFRGGKDNEDRLTIERERSEQADTLNLINHGQGIPAAILSARHRWPIGWIRHIRQRNNQDPDNGYPRPNWRELPERDRYHVIQGLREQEGLSQREAAMRLGVSKGNVQRYWDGQEAA